MLDSAFRSMLAALVAFCTLLTLASHTPAFDRSHAPPGHTTAHTG